MSAILGPIHHWLYNKIKIQNAIVEEIMNYTQEKYPELDLKNRLEDESENLNDIPLEEQIDTSNIHGWLQEKVSLVEYRLAYAVTALLKEEADTMEDLKKLFREEGAKASGKYDNKDAPEIFKNLNDTLLDGMPCDHANQLISQDDNEVVWERNVCVHENYWKEVGGDIRNYYNLREEFIKGFVKESGYTYEKVDETTSRIKR